MKKKSQKIKIILIIILWLVILSWVGIASYYLFFKNDQHEISDNGIKLNLSSKIVTELYEKISDLYLCQTKVSFDPFSGNPTTTKITIDEMDSDLITLLIFRQLELSGYLKYNKTDVVSVSLKQFEDASKQLFGYVPDFSKDFSPSGQFMYQFINFKFIDNNYIGTKVASGCEAEFPVKRSTLVDLENTKNNLKLIVVTYEISYEQYQANDLSNPENSIEKYIDKNKDKLSQKTYKYVFKKKQNNYYFTGVEYINT